MKIRAISQIKHNGKLIPPGKTVDLPANVATGLVKAKVAEYLKEEKEKEDNK